MRNISCPTMTVSDWDYVASGRRRELLIPAPLVLKSVSPFRRAFWDIVEHVVEALHLGL
jgi:hypothetical protein